MEYHFSDYGARSTRPSPVNEMMAAFATDFRDGLDINLGVGYVNEETIPREAMVEAVAAIVEHPHDYRQAFNYGGPRGSRNLHDALRRFYIENRIGGIDEAFLNGRECLIGANGATSILEAFAELFPPGIVVTADPMYYIFCNFLERRGFRIVTVPEDTEGIRVDLLEDKLAQLGAAAAEIAFVYVVTVNNPSCAILSNARRRELVRLVTNLSRRQSRKIPLILDGAYEWLIHDPVVETPRSAMLDDELGIVYELGTLSKILAPALRIGFAFGPPGPLMEALAQRTSDVGFSAPLLNQEIAAYLLNHHINAQIERVNAGYREKAALVGRAIARHLGPHLEQVSGGSAGFYYYLTFREIETGPESPFFRYLTRTTGLESVDGPESARLPRVIYIPGEYCVHPQGDSVAAGRRQLRLSYGFEDPARIEAALRLMSVAVDFALPRGQD
jgi:2-aminoadipate transaminase